MNAAERQSKIEGLLAAFRPQEFETRSAKENAEQTEINKKILAENPERIKTLTIAGNLPDTPTENQLKNLSAMVSVFTPDIKEANKTALLAAPSSNAVNASVFGEYNPLAHQDDKTTAKLLDRYKFDGEKFDYSDKFWLAPNKTVNAGDPDWDGNIYVGEGVGPSLFSILERGDNNPYNADGKFDPQGWSLRPKHTGTTLKHAIGTASIIAPAFGGLFGAAAESVAGAEIAAGQSIYDTVRIGATSSAGLFAKGAKLASGIIKTATASIPLGIAVTGGIGAAYSSAKNNAVQKVPELFGESKTVPQSSMSEVSRSDAEVSPPVITPAITPVKNSSTPTGDTFESAGISSDSTKTILILAVIVTAYFWSKNNGR